MNTDLTEWIEFQIVMPFISRSTRTTTGLHWIHKRLAAL